MAQQASGTSTQVSSQAGGLTGTPLGGIVGMAQAGVEGLFTWASETLDQWFPPEKREALKNKIMNLVSQRPKFSAFLLCQIALSGIPLLLFLTMSLSVLVFALLVGLIVGVLGAVLFTVFCLGFALIILLPILFMTTFAAVFIFLWGLGAYYLVKWFNNSDIPGMKSDFMNGIKKQMGGIVDEFPALNGESGAPAGEEKEGKEQEPTADKKDASHSKSQKPAGHGNEAGGGGDDDDDDDDQKEQKPKKLKSPPKSTTKRTQPPSSGKATGVDQNHHAGDVKKTAGGTVAGATAAVNG